VSPEEFEPALGCRFETEEDPWSARSSRTGHARLAKDARGDAELAPGRVTDALTLRVLLHSLLEGGFELGEVGGVLRVVELRFEVEPPLDEFHPVDRVSLVADLLFGVRDALLQILGIRDRALIDVERFEVVTNRLGLSAALCERFLVLFRQLASRDILIRGDPGIAL
jgi:hypothetical protein